MSSVLLGIGSKLLMALVTDVFAKKVVLRLLKEASKKTTNTLDDDIVSYIDQAWQQK